MERYHTVRGENAQRNWTTVRREIALWTQFETEKGKGKEGKDLESEVFWSTWDAVPEQSEEYHLDALLAKEELVGKAEQSGKCGQLKEVPFDASIFEGYNDKQLIKL